MKIDHSQAMETAVLAGNILLKSGAEVFRVEQTIRMIAKAYGVESYNTFIVSSGIITTAGSQKEAYFAKAKHIPFGATRLDKVEAVNQLSREITEGKHTVEEAWQRLEEIDAMPKKRRWALLLASGVGSGGFCFTFGGSFADSLAAFLVGVILYTYLLGVDNLSLSKITRTIGGGALSTFLSILVWQLGLGNTLSFIISGAIMPLVPGVSFTTAIRDIADGDYIAGSVRMIDALLTAFCIAAGVGVVFTIWRQFFGGGVVL